MSTTAIKVSIIDRFSLCLNLTDILSAAFGSAVGAYGLQFDIFQHSKDLCLLHHEIPRSFKS